MNETGQNEMSEPLYKRETLYDIIHRRSGGPARISRYFADRGISVSASAISRWAKSGVPLQYWGHIVEMTRDNRPVTVDDLAKLHGVRGQP